MRYRVTRVWTVEAASQTAAVAQTLEMPVDVLDVIEAPNQRVGDGVFHQTKATLDRAWELYEQLSVWAPIANTDYDDYPLPPLAQLLSTLSMVELTRIFDVAITASRMKRGRGDELL